MRPELSDYGVTVCFSDLVFLFDANALLYCSCSQCFNNRENSVYAVMLTASWLLPESG